MRTGTVKWFNTRKGYGFIKPVDGGFDVCVEIGAVERAGLIDLTEGQTINFEIVVDERTGETFAETLVVLAGGPERLGNGGGEVGGPPGALSFAALLARQRPSRLGGRGAG
jgi:CspA family cold shock protein